MTSWLIMRMQSKDNHAPGSRPGRCGPGTSAALAFRRAENVAGFLEKQGISASMIQIEVVRGVPPFLGPPLGSTYYDSLQVKATKRYSHGLTMTAAFTWQKELVRGAETETGASVPVSASADGLPVGVQVIGRPHEEELVLAVAEKIETARGQWQAPPI